MKQLTKWILALLAVACVAGFSGAWTGVQDGAGAGKRTAPVGVQGKKTGKARAEKQAALKKILPMIKTSLPEAITLAEKETSGKAYSADLLPRDGKPTIVVSVLANDKFTTAHVDPETKKVTIPSQQGKTENEPAEGGAEDEGEDEEGG